MKLSASANGIIFSWLAFGEGLSSFDVAESARALAQISYKLHKIKFLPVCDCVIRRRQQRWLPDLAVAFGLAQL